MPIVYNYEGPLASPAIDSAVNAGTRIAAAQRRSELERLALAREQMAQERMLSQQRLQAQLAAQQYGQYGDLQRLMLQYGMQQQQQERNFEQQRAMADYENQVQAERDAQYWKSRESFTDYQLNAEGKAEVQKIERQIASVKANPRYSEAQQAMAISQLEMQRDGIVNNAAFLTADGEHKPGTVHNISGQKYWIDGNLKMQNLGPADLQRKELDTLATAQFSTVEDKNGNQYFVQHTKDGFEVVDPARAIPRSTQTSQHTDYISSLPPKDRATVSAQKIDKITALQSMQIEGTTTDRLGATTKTLTPVGLTYDEAKAMVDLEYGIYQNDIVMAQQSQEPPKSMPGRPSLQETMKLAASAKAKMNAARAQASGAVASSASVNNTSPAGQINSGGALPPPPQWHDMDNGGQALIIPQGMPPDQQVDYVRAHVRKGGFFVDPSNGTLRQRTQ